MASTHGPLTLIRQLCQIAREAIRQIDRDAAAGDDPSASKSRAVQKKRS